MKGISSSYRNQSSETVKQMKNVGLVDYFAAGNQLTKFPFTEEVGFS